MNNNSINSVDISLIPTTGFSTFTKVNHGVSTQYVYLSNFLPDKNAIVIRLIDLKNSQSWTGGVQISNKAFLATISKINGKFVIGLFSKIIESIPYKIKAIFVEHEGKTFPLCQDCVVVSYGVEVYKPNLDIFAQFVGFMLAKTGAKTPTLTSGSSPTKKQ